MLIKILGVVYYNDIPVGTFCCRIETNGEQTKLYVMTMGILAVSASPPISVAHDSADNMSPSRTGRED